MTNGSDYYIPKTEPIHTLLHELCQFSRRLSRINQQDIKKWAFDRFAGGLYFWGNSWQPDMVAANAWSEKRCCGFWPPADCCGELRFFLFWV